MNDEDRQAQQDIYTRRQSRILVSEMEQAADRRAVRVYQARQRLMAKDRAFYSWAIIISLAVTFALVYAAPSIAHIINSLRGH